MEELSVLMLAAAVNKTVSFVKAFANKDWNTVITQAVVWVVGICLLALAAHAMIAENMVIFSARLGDWDGSSVVLGGYVLGSTGAFAYDWKKARDNTDSSKETPLVGPSAPPA
jgi:cadmium resistance protein CadD (predicted permease)